MFKSSIILLTGALTATPAFACSICRCGDPTFNALGSGHMAESGWRFALDYDQTRKSQGDAADEFSEVTEQRNTLLLAYGFSDRFSIIARQPYTQRELTEIVAGDTEHSRASGAADLELQTQTRLWASPFEGDVGARTSLFGTVGVKTPWGENDARHNGERLDEHAQPGTGSTDWIVGLSLVHQLNPKSAVFASIQQRATGENDFGYRYGRTTLVNLALEKKLGSNFDTALEANYRSAARDRIEGSDDDNTGGSLLFLTPRLLWHAGSGAVLRVAAQIPTSQNGLNGEQHERTVWNVGFSWVPGD